MSMLDGVSQYSEQNENQHDGMTEFGAYVGRKEKNEQEKFR
jgi:hypothetical protein